jgi:hypothetical protein
VLSLPSTTSGTAALRGRLRDGDVLVTLGAGDVWRLASLLVEGDSP